MIEQQKDFYIELLGKQRLNFLALKLRGCARVRGQKLKTSLEAANGKKLEQVKDDLQNLSRSLMGLRKRWAVWMINHRGVTSFRESGESWKMSESKAKETVCIKLGLNMKNIEIEEARRERERFDESQDRLQ